MKILLDYVFPISIVTPTPQASTAFLKQACLVVNPNAGHSGNAGTIYPCVNVNEVAAVTDNVEATQLFNAGMSKVFILIADNLQIASDLLAEASEFFTVLISNDFTDAEIDGIKASLVKSNLTFTSKVVGAAGDNISVAFITGGTAGAEVVSVVANAISVSMESTVSTANQLKAALDGSPAAAALISTAVASGQGATAQAAFALAHLASGADALDVGAFKGVVGVSSTDESICALRGAKPNFASFFKASANGAKNMIFAFGSLLANALTWQNQQYITMPFDDAVTDLGDANTMFDDKVSFVIDDDEFGTRLALFAAGGKAITAPYIVKNLSIDLQSRALQWISQNQPDYTLTEATLLETRLQEDVINDYIRRGLLDGGTISIALVEDNFVASGTINVPQPKALWRVVSEMTETV